MPTLTEIRDAIHAKVAGVTGVGVVHKYERYANKTSDLAAKYFSGTVPNKRLTGWFIRRASKRVTGPAVGRFVIWNEWMIRGYMSVEDADATELTCDDLVEAICAAFQADETLGGVITGTVQDVDDGNLVGIQVEESGPVLFAGVLCHSARLKLYTQHFE